MLENTKIKTPETVLILAVFAGFASGYCYKCN
jgi:hypothetical protein